MTGVASLMKMGIKYILRSEPCYQYLYRGALSVSIQRLENKFGPHSILHTASRLKTSHYQLTFCGGKLFVILPACPALARTNKTTNRGFLYRNLSSVQMVWKYLIEPQPRLSYLSISYHRLEMI